MRHLALLLLIGCTEYDLSGKGDGNPGPLEEEGAPDIVVEPGSIDFGSLAWDEGPSGEERVTIGNYGDANLDLHSVRLASGGPFTLTAPGSVQVEPGGYTTFTVSFDPSGGSATGEVEIESNDPDTPVVRVGLSGDVRVPDLVISPDHHDFGMLEQGQTDAVSLSLSNAGDATLWIEQLDWSATSSDLSFDANEGANGTLPWVLEPGEALTVTVSYAPTDAGADEGTLVVHSNDPTAAQQMAVVEGESRAFEGFSTGWYVYDDGVPYETTSNPSYPVDHHGDEDLYWYEPSGAHGLIGSSDPESDFAILRDYVIAHAGGPVSPSGPFSYAASSTLATFEYATFTYFLCDFYLDASDDPALYEIVSGFVDDGIQVMVNGQILGRLKLGESGRWPLSHAVPGEVNTLIVILVDDSQIDKYVSELAFYRDGVMVTE